VTDRPVVVVDASALCAIYFSEPEADDFRDCILRAEAVVTPVNLWETQVSACRRDPAPTASTDVLQMIEDLGVAIRPISPGEAKGAFEAWDRFGKGRHAAGLNMGDCFAFAAAKELGAALLFKGFDFGQTDAVSAQLPPAMKS